MSRQQDPKGVILTGYISNIEVVSPASGVNSAEEIESSSLSRRTGHYSVQNRAKNAPGKPPYHRCNSQDSLDELAMDDYWTEVENITLSGEGDAEPHEEVQLKVPDEGEQEEAWLTEAGLATLFDESASDPEDMMGLLSTLTRTQAAAVEKRVEKLQQTLRKRNKQHQVPDVRDIFKLPGTPESKEDEAKSPERSENRKKDITTDGQAMGLGNRAGPAEQSVSEPETDINLEVSFSDQALSYKEGSKGSSEALTDADDKLPNFKLSRDKTGLTKVGDLSPQDMKKVHRLVLIEMTALFDTAGIDLKAHKAVKLKVKESGLFGVPLAALLEQDQRRQPGTKVPIILQRLISHIEDEGLDTEGLLRIPGAAIRVKAVCVELEGKFYEGLFPWESLKQHDAASLLKLFIRELPHPLLTVEYLSAFIAVLKLPTKKQQLQALNLLVLLLPESSRDTLKVLMEFFQRVIDHKEQNKMTLNNVAVVMAPNIFMFKGFRNKISEQQEFSLATETANIVRLLIRYQNLLWTIPKFIMNQVRKQNTENQKKMSKDRAMMKLLKKMAYEREKHEKQEKPLSEVDSSSQGFIRVQAPQFSKVSMAVQLTEELQASDVLSRFLSQDSSVSVKREDLCLYEIGGNIQERCLDEETYMKDLLELNPSAEWFIKCIQR
ncbi:rho GTPase-activating protein 18 isoform 2-T2 [Salvelinus alpinus]|uniref:Rho GTPase-activating protein 18-like isoform X2 n=1 Tax=Salvelinus namaycush TaxID=8040 RepID=A0A8U0P6T5_SALNM|nr:rho GTPase-activating protein 18 isoform X2 [Salvelinus alpinus]XP_038819008.1 rho GTPase-activating protein 18-like isoform X2 [Salvelinus namaycush]XP_055740700.1 rho GTPase-activating protein 18 isoform X2 [Salvelinus fontinalis]